MKFFCVCWPLNIFDQNRKQMCFRNSPIQSKHPVTTTLRGSHINHKCFYLKVFTSRMEAYRCISWRILSDCEPRLPNSWRSAFWRAMSASRPSWLLALLTPPPDPPPAPPPPGHQTTLRVSFVHVLFNLGLQLLDLECV